MDHENTIDGDLLGGMDPPKVDYKAKSDALIDELVSNILDQVFYEFKIKRLSGASHGKGDSGPG